MSGDVMRESSLSPPMPDNAEEKLCMLCERAAMPGGSDIRQRNGSFWLCVLAGCWLLLLHLLLLIGC